MAVFYKHPRNTKATLDTRAGQAALVPYQAYWLTDLNRFAVATSTSAYIMLPNTSETKNITVSTTAPSNPSVGDLWVDTN